VTNLLASIVFAKGLHISVVDQWPWFSTLPYSSVQNWRGH